MAQLLTDIKHSTARCHDVTGRKITPPPNEKLKIYPCTPSLSTHPLPRSAEPSHVVGRQRALQRRPERPPRRRVVVVPPLQVQYRRVGRQQAAQHPVADVRARAVEHDEDVVGERLAARQRQVEVVIELRVAQQRRRQADEQLVADAEAVEEVVGFGGARQVVARADVEPEAPVGLGARQQFVLHPPADPVADQPVGLRARVHEVHDHRVAGVRLAVLVTVAARATQRVVVGDVPAMVARDDPHQRKQDNEYAQRDGDQGLEAAALAPRLVCLHRHVHHPHPPPVVQTVQLRPPH